MSSADPRRLTYPSHREDEDKDKRHGPADDAEDAVVADPVKNPQQPRDERQLGGERDGEVESGVLEERLGRHLAASR